jgi:hypothetical protein
MGDIGTLMYILMQNANRAIKVSNGVGLRGNANSTTKYRM